MARIARPVLIVAAMAAASACNSEPLLPIVDNGDTAPGDTTLDSGDTADLGPDEGDEGDTIDGGEDVDAPDGETDDGGADEPPGDVDNELPEVDPPDCDPSTCGLYACDDDGRACRTSCRGDDECAPEATCQDGACVEREPRGYRWVAVVSTADGADALDSPNPGPDLDAIAFTADGLQRQADRIVAGEIGRLGGSENVRSDFAGVANGLDTLGGSPFDCFLDAIPGYTSLAGPGGFVVAEFNEPFEAGAMLQVFEIDSSNCADVTVGRPDTFEVYVTNFEPIATGPGSAERIRELWCLVGVSSSTGGTFAQRFDPTACEDLCPSIEACPPAPPEDCGNEVDDDGDGNTDCDDSECLEDERCSRPAEDCRNGIDDDGNGLTDCGDPACSDDEACVVGCGAREVERGGGCSPRWVPGDLTGRPLSYVRRVEIPTDDEPCCIDYDGDGDLDNGFAGLVGLFAVLAADVDIAATLEEAIADDSWVSVLEWTAWSEGVPNIGWHAATNDLDGDGAPDQSFDDRARGRGVFRLLHETIDSFGARSAFNNGRFDGPDLVVAGPADLVFPGLPISLLGDEFDLVSLAGQMRLQRSYLIGEVRETPLGIQSLDTGGRAGVAFAALIPLDDLFREMDRALRQCPCPGIDGRFPMLAYGDNGTEYVVSCEQTPTGDCSGASTTCENLGLLCSLVGQLVPVFGLGDIDADGNGVVDSMSIGLRLSLTGASLGTPPVTPAP